VHVYTPQDICRYPQFQIPRNKPAARSEM